MKQGDFLSCIPFILCMDPLIRNIKLNSNIDRIEVDGYLALKLVDYTDDVACLTINSRIT